MAGQKIHEHGSWVGGRSKGSVFPEGVKHKMYTSAEGAGSVGKYEDTSEAIHGQQEAGIRKAKAHAAKSEYRN